MTEFIDEPDTIRNEAMDDGLLVTDNRTTELCKLLEERGVKWKTKSYSSALLSNERLTDTYWQAGNAAWQFTECSDGRTYLSLIGIWPNCTPEQVIATTLGSDQDQELVDLAHNAWSMALCAMQGMPIPAEWGDAVERGLRKYGINVDEDLAGFEVNDDER